MKPKVKTYNWLSYSDFDTLVNNVFFPHVEDDRKKFYCEADLEAGSMEVHTFNNITRNDWVAAGNKTTWDYKMWKEFLNCEFPLGMTVVVLEYFVSRDILPEGNYMIEFDY